MVNKNSPPYYAIQNRRMAFRIALEHNEFSLAIENNTFLCLNISIQGCLITSNANLSTDILAGKLLYNNEDVGVIRCKIIWSDNKHIALHFLNIKRRTQEIIEDYIIDTQKRSLRKSSELKIIEDEKRLLGICR
mgnify:CR=1 FL=1